MAKPKAGVAAIRVEKTGALVAGMTEKPRYRPWAIQAFIKPKGSLAWYGVGVVAWFSRTILCQLLEKKFHCHFSHSLDTVKSEEAYAVRRRAIVRPGSLQGSYMFLDNRQSKTAHRNLAHVQ